MAVKPQMADATQQPSRGATAIGCMAPLAGTATAMGDTFTGASVVTGD